MRSAAIGEGPAKICIVTPSYLSTTPRVVKEATALSQAGYDVRVVFAQENSATHREFDQIIMASSAWRATVVRAGLGSSEKLRWILATARQRAWRSVQSSSWMLEAGAEAAEGRFYKELVKAAARERADLFIGHYPIGLAVAAKAATRWRSRLGFDAEDLHSAEGHGPEQAARVRFIERKYIAECDYISASSNGVSAALAEMYNVVAPRVIHNVFPWADRAQLDGRCLDRTDAQTLSLYWYSQTIGLDRGIQDIIRAVGAVRRPIQIHLRGRLAADVRLELEMEASAHGVFERLHFHEQVSPQDLLSRAAEHDIGLALERGEPQNRALCTTNKLFLYMLAGLGIVATDVPGQRAVLDQMPEAASLYPPNDVPTLAGILTQWQTDPLRMRRAKAAALEAAREHWNWELESHRLVKGVEEVLQRPSRRELGRLVQGRPLADQPRVSK